VLEPSNFDSHGKPSRKIVLEKVFGDFKRLHSHLIETFQNELKEFERFERIASYSH